MAFGAYKDNMEKNGSVSHYVSIKDGTAVKMVLLGEEITRSCAFIEGTGFVPCKKEDGGKLRFAINVYCDGSVKVFEQPEQGYRALGELDDSLREMGEGRIDDYWIMYKKYNNKKYEARAIKMLSDEEKEKFKKMKQHDLTKLVAWLKDEKNVAPPDDNPPPPSDDDTPF